MSVLIGGSGSTGSSLLRQILNRHPNLFCGPETSLFCKEGLYKNWEKNKKSILSKGRNGLRSNGWHIYRGVDLLKEELNYNEDQIKNLIKESASLYTFSNQLFAHNLSQTGSRMWIEKTPSNAYNFSAFLNQNEQSKVIHIYRNPYDTITSLVKRGFSQYYATSLYLLNTAFGLSQNKSNRYHQLSYEDLVQNSVTCVSTICKFLNVDYSAKMLETTESRYIDDPSRIGKWRYNEQAHIGKESIGSFAKLQYEEQSLLVYAIKSISIKDTVMKEYNLQQNSVEAICKVLNYDYIDDQHGSHLKTIKQQRNADLKLRTRKLAYFNPLNYPILLNE